MGFELSFELTVQSTPRALNLLKFLGYFHCFCVAKRTRAPSPVARILRLPGPGECRVRRRARRRRRRCVLVHAALV